MREVINSIFNILINDEQLLRLLWYKPKSKTGNDPLDSSLPNILEMNDYWDIVNHRIMLVDKINDLEADPLCRIYISAGRRKPKFENYLMATQEIGISILTHEDYEVDMRSIWISDRLNELLSLEYITGAIGRLDYKSGSPYDAPLQYRQYTHVYEYTTDKK